MVKKVLWAQQELELVVEVVGLAHSMLWLQKPAQMGKAAPMVVLLDLQHLPGMVEEKAIFWSEAAGEMEWKKVEKRHCQHLPGEVVSERQVEV